MSVVAVAESSRAEQTQTRRGAPKKGSALTAQINVRMDAELKASADDAFASAGLSSSDVIRTVYVRAAELGKNLHCIDDLVCIGQTKDKEDERDRNMRIFEFATHAVERTFADFGLTYDPSSIEPMTEEELEAQVYEDFIKGNL